MWPFKKKEAVAWIQEVPSIQEQIDKRKEWIEDNKAKLNIMKEYERDIWADEVKEMVNLEYCNYCYNKQIKALETQLPPANT